jgi:long-chain acyl-CoA synthetase
MIKQATELLDDAAESSAVLHVIESTASRPLSGVARCLLQGKATNRIALESEQGSWTYGDIDTASYKIAAYLLGLGARKGDRVLLIANNSFFWVASYIAALRAALVCVPLPTSLCGEELSFIVHSTAARFALVDARYHARNTSELPPICITDQGSLSSTTHDSEVYVFERVLDVDTGPVELPRIVDSDLATLMFTSGSTRRPRGVMVSHGNVIANTRSIAQYLNLTERDSILTVLPFHYCFGTSLLHTHLMVGGKLVLNNRFTFTEPFLQHLQSSKCTGFAGVPSHYQILLRRSNIRQMSFPHLRYAQQAGGHMAPAIIRELREALPHTEVFVMYGQTEATARLAYVPPSMLDQKMGSVGKAIPGVTLSIRTARGEVARVGEMGEIVAEGPNVAMGYWEQPAETATAFREGRLYTGDMAIADEDGFIYIADRVGDFVKVGGTRTSCRGLEEQMLEFQPLLEVAVVGIPDPISGEAIKAFVVPRDPESNQFLERFRLFCTEHLQIHHIPKEIVPLQALPKNSSGKVMKSELKKFHDAQPGSY